MEGVVGGFLIFLAIVVIILIGLDYFTTWFD